MAVLVLVVEALFRQQFRRQLRAERFALDFAASAPDALRRVANATERAPAPVFSDINMPGMTGLEMLPRMKEMRPDLRVIVITAYGDDDTKRMAIESGAEGLLAKPIDFALLREQIDTRLGRAV